MKFNWNKFFSISVSEEEYFNDQKDKIEYAGCKLSGEYCLNYLPKINECFRESEQFFRMKDFNRSIDALESAYIVADKIREPDCQKCAHLFKATIVQSLENIHSELKRMAGGFFSSNRYYSSYIKAEELLMQLKSEKEVHIEYPETEKSLALQLV